MCLYVRELKMDEGQKIQRILRRSTNRVKVRRAQVVLASEQGYKAPAIAELVHYSEHHVRAIIKEFNQRGLSALEPKPRSGRPTEFTEDDKAFIHCGNCQVPSGPSGLSVQTLVAGKVA